MPDAKYYWTHKERLLEEQRAYRKKTKEYWYNYNILQRYGVTRKQYDVMLALQEGVCAICGKGDNRRLGVDHNHESGKVRGLLCNKCNHGIGCFNDDVTLLQKAINYLKEA